MRSVHSKIPSVLLTPCDLVQALPNILSLQAGSRSAPVKPKISDSINKTDYDSMQISRDVARSLAILPGQYRIIQHKQQKVKVGPVVAILTSGIPNKPVPTGKKGRLFRQLILQGWKEGLFIYYFYPEDVLWERQLIRGYTCNPQGKWVGGLFAFPDIVYNRILYRSIEKQKKVQNLLERFDHNPDIYLFNRRFLNKWEVSQVLVEDSDTRVWIPETRSYSPANLRVLLSRHRELFLKPANSSKGQGIVKVVWSSGDYRYARTEWNGKAWTRVPNISELNTRLKRDVSDLKRYVIQQGIPLARIKDRVFDLRTQAQKNGDGEWVLTGVGVRIAARNRFVTHVPNGGTRGVFAEVIKEVFPSVSIQKSIEAELRKICRIVPEVLEQGLKIPLGILSLDIGVDSSGKLWILEINSKPASFDEPDIRRKHIGLLLNYYIYAAQHLSKGR